MSFATDEIVPIGLQVKLNFAHFYKATASFRGGSLFRILAIIYSSL